jgi:hypothetical protein
MDLNQEILHSISQVLQKDINYSFTEKFVHEPLDTIDRRISISPKLPINRDEFPRYQQVFEEKNGFHPDLSIIDLIFNEGPSSPLYFE